LDLRVGEHIPIFDLTGQESLSGRKQAALVSQLFDFGRYLAICSGRPHSSNANQNSPINLQGIWCQDRRPPWDSDLHLDLNIQMCYWPLPMVGLSDLLPLVADWMQRLLPQANVAARDQFDALGAVWPITCDLNNLGNMEDLCMPWAGGGAWLVQVLWTGWEYTQDIPYLRERVYPLLLETALFYQSYAFVNDAGYIDLPISMSPEMGVKGRSRYSALTGIASVDIELMRATFEALLKAGKVLDSDQDKWGEWEDFISKLPKLPILASGLVGEWVYPHEEIDPYHRHRTPLIGLAPGDRITGRTTPEELEACRRYLNFRRSDLKSSCAWSNVWDAQFLARLGQGDEALEVFEYIAKRWLLEGGFLACLDWREESGTLNWFPGQKIVQVEASIGMVASVCELFIQDRQGIIEFLPALPTAFPEGSLSGVCLRGGFEADFTWKSGLLSKVTIRSKKGGDCRVDVTGRAAQLQVTSGHQVNIESGLMTALVTPDMPLELNAMPTP
jgi:alpha-L-fucosidase 2